MIGICTFGDTSVWINIMLYISFEVVITLVGQIVGIGITCWMEYVLVYPILIRLVVNCIQLGTKYGCNGGWWIWTTIGVLCSSLPFVLCMKFFKFKLCMVPPKFACPNFQCCGLPLFNLFWTMFVTWFTKLCRTNFSMKGKLEITCFSH